MLDVLRSVFGVLSLLLNLNIQKEYINLSPYNYPKPNDKNYDYIAIVETTDIHGYGLERKTKSISEDNRMKYKEYEHGGSSLFSKYLEALRKEWGKNRVLYFDAGDKYQGGIESSLSNGDIITKISNFLKLDANCLGNHEFDNGLNFLRRQMNISEFPWIVSNLRYNNTDELYKFINDTNKIVKKKVFKIYKNIKIGVIGYTPNFNYYTKDSGVKKIKFLNYSEYIVKLSKELKEIDKVNAVILLVHVGIRCPNTSKKLDIYGIENKTDFDCDYSEDDGLNNFLIGEGKGYIDAVLGGHVHYPSHNFIDDIPIIHSKDRGDTFHILYLPFDKKTHQLVKNKIKIEGPVPICNLISEKNNECGFSERSDVMLQFYFHKYIIRRNEKIEKEVLDMYKKELQKYNKYLCTNKDGIYTRGTGENLIGNLVCDALRYEAKVELSFINSGAFRTTWYPGDITLEDVYNMYSFTAFIVSFEVTGEELYEIIETVQNGKRAYYPCSGFRQFLIKNNTSGKWMVDKLTLDDGTLIDKNKTYTIATNDFLADGGDDFINVEHLFKNKKTLMDIRIAIENFLIKEEELIAENYFKSEPEDRRIVFIE